jgi:hypothetical protein
MITLDITPDDGEPYRVVATSRDIAWWERTTRGASFAKLQEDMHMTDLYKIAWRASTRLGLFEGSQADFADSCDLKQDDDDPADSDPTTPGA